MTLKLYSWPQSSGTRVAWALEELGLPYDYVELDPKKSEHRASAYLAIHPHGKVPALIEDGRRYFESGAILLHLAEAHGAGKGLWPAADDPARADALCWTVWAMTELGPYMMQFLYHGLDTPVSYRPADRSAASAEYNRSQFERCLDALESRLAAREFLLDRFSLADLACASWLVTGRALGAGLGGRPAADAWLTRCAQRPAFARAR